MLGQEIDLQNGSETHAQRDHERHEDPNKPQLHVWNYRTWRLLAEPPP